MLLTVSPTSFGLYCSGCILVTAPDRAEQINLLSSLFRERSKLKKGVPMRAFAMEIGRDPNAAALVPHKCGVPIGTWISIENSRDLMHRIATRFEVGVEVTSDEDQQHKRPAISVFESIKKLVVVFLNEQTTQEQQHQKNEARINKLVDEEVALTSLVISARQLGVLVILVAKSPNLLTPIISSNVRAHFSFAKCRTSWRGRSFAEWAERIGFRGRDATLFVEKAMPDFCVQASASPSPDALASHLVISMRGDRVIEDLQLYKQAYWREVAQTLLTADFSSDPGSVLSLSQRQPEEEDGDPTSIAEKDVFESCYCPSSSSPCDGDGASSSSSC